MVADAPKILRDALVSLPDGPVSDPASIIVLLANAWRALENSDEGGMQDWKLNPERVENLRWNAPLLSFAIARHGAMVGGGSTRAEVQHWIVDLQKQCAYIDSTTKRQVLPMAPRWSAKKYAKELVAAAVAGQPHVALEHVADGSVIVHGDRIVELNRAVKQTLEGRRAKWPGALRDAFDAVGWVSTPRGWRRAT